MDVTTCPDAGSATRSWTAPAIYLIVAVAAVVSTHGHFPVMMAGGGVFAVWCFRTTLLYFARIDAAAEREAAARTSEMALQGGPHPSS